MYEYTTEVFAVGLEGLAVVDTDKLGRLAADGWEPSLMTPVHNGFATLVLFRRETDGTAVPGRLVAPAPKARAGTPKAVASKAVAGRGTRAAAAKTVAGRGVGDRTGAAAGGGRVRRARPS